LLEVSDGDEMRRDEIDRDDLFGGFLEELVVDVETGLLLLKRLDGERDDDYKPFSSGLKGPRPLPTLADRVDSGASRDDGVRAGGTRTQGTLEAKEPDVAR